MSRTDATMAAQGAAAGGPGGAPLPGRLAGGVSRIAGWAVPAAIALAFVIPLVIDSPFQLQMYTLAALNAAVVAPLVLSLGYTGLLNLSHGTFYGLGAYTTAILVTDHGWPFEAAMLAAAVVAGLGGGLLSLASARVRGDYFVLVSLGVTIAVAQALANLPDLTRGREGFFGIPALDLFGLSFSEPVTAFYLCLSLLAVMYLFLHRVTGGFLGRAMLVVRHDDVAARGMGIRPLAVRVTAMVIGSALVGAAGSFLVATVQFISPADFGFDASFMLSLYVIIGGMASLPGAVVVAVVFTLLNEQFRGISDYRLGLVGLAVLVAVLLRGGVLRDLLAPVLARSGRRDGDARR
ncbi:branched-chain amino acid ABC transporter permease [Spongiactinospora sp. TRM90649]|uniref:branched-chain amino acid ABC transporter permease n=1 Tax=Spongiactinospora sp. TRM90649 TaxID=3031114 RepID=UPI0023F8D763|nr:branched-chain amino acid ABC transporter permease [Spongiactinospora sp. TRM90649]MDF5758303.1 branched-chain amino acid ABC transporter permease [Spongiactinospora sp. TRM90649]